MFEDINRQWLSEIKKIKQIWSYKPNCFDLSNWLATLSTTYSS